MSAPLRCRKYRAAWRWFTRRPSPTFRPTSPQPDADTLSLPPDFIVSDTDELVWLEGLDSGGCVLVDTPRCQAVVGHQADTTTSLANLVVAPETPFAAIQVVSLDGLPIAESAKLLLVTGARVANTGMAWTDADRHTLSAWGEAPTRIEPVLGTVGLRELAAADRVTLQPLDPTGRPQGDALPFVPDEEGLAVALPGTTPWYVIDVSRS